MRVKYKVFFRIALLGILSLITLFPLLSTPIAADDMWLMLIPAYFGDGAQGLLNWLVFQFQFWAPRGRFFIFGILNSGVWSFAFETRLEYKIFLLLLNIAFVYVIYIISFKIVKNHNISLFISVTYISLSQFIGGYDPRSQFFGLMLITTSISVYGIYLITTLNSAFRYRHYARFILTFVIGLLFYESSVFFIPILLILTLLFKRINLSIFIAYFIPTFAIEIFIIFLKFNSKIQDGYSLIRNPEIIVDNYLLQIKDIMTFSAIPNYLLNPITIIFLLSFSLLLVNLKEKTFKIHTNNKNKNYIFYLSLFVTSIAILPIPASLTEKYSDLIDNYPYIHVFQLQVFLAFILGTFFALIDLKLGKITLIIFVALNLMYTVQHNWKFTQVNDWSRNNLGDQSIFGYQRDLTERMIAANSFNEVKVITNNARFWAGDNKPWLTAGYLFGRESPLKLMNSAKWWESSTSIPSTECLDNSLSINKTDCFNVNDIVFFTYSNDYRIGFTIFDLQYFKINLAEKVYLIYSDNFIDFFTMSKCSNFSKDSLYGVTSLKSNLYRVSSNLSRESIVECLIKLG